MEVSDNVVGMVGGVKSVVPRCLLVEMSPELEIGGTKGESVGSEK